MKIETEVKQYVFPFSAKYLELKVEGVNKFYQNAITLPKNTDLKVGDKVMVIIEKITEEKSNG